MKKFFLSMLALVALSGVAVAQEVVATYDFTKMREYPWGIPDGVTLTMENQCLNAQGSGWWQFKLAEAQLEPESPYTITVAIKASKKGATPFAVGNWSGDDWQGLADNDADNKISYDEKWATSSCVLTTKTAENPLDFMFQPGGYDGELNIAWVVISKGHCEPEATPLMPISLDNAVEVAKVDFATLDAYTFDGAATLKDGVLVAEGDDVFNIMEGLKLEPEKDYGVIAKVKASSDVELTVALGDWGATVDNTLLAYDVWNEAVIRLGYAPLDEDGNIPENSFVMISPEDDFDGTIEVEWVKLVYFLEPEPEPEPVYEIVWHDAIVDLTGDGGVSDHVWARTGEIQDWTDAPTGVCANPDGEGQVFFANVQAHPYPEDTANDPVPDHHTQFFIYFPDYLLMEGDKIKVSFDYYSSIPRKADSQAHCTPGDYNHYMFIGSLDTKPEWQHFETEVTLTSEHAGGEKGCSTVTLNLATRDNENQTDMPESIFYMNHINVSCGILTEVKPGGNPSEGDLTEKVLATMYPGDAELIGWGCDGLLEKVEEDGREALKIAQTAEEKNFWEVQFAYDYDYEPGKTYYFSFDVKGDAADAIPSGFQCTDGWVGCGDVTSFAITPEWKNVVISGTPTATEDGKLPNRWVASIGNYVGTFFISNMKLYVMDDDNAVETIKPVVIPVKGVYNMMGVKVADSLDEVAAPGVYITNGKKYIKK